MDIPTGTITGTTPPPVTAPVEALHVRISPAARRSHAWIAGDAAGGEARYPDIYAFTWYEGGSWYTANSRFGNRRGARGLEDGRNWQQ